MRVNFVGFQTIAVVRPRGAGCQASQVPPVAATMHVALAELLEDEHVWAGGEHVRELGLGLLRGQGPGMLAVMSVTGCPVIEEVAMRSRRRSTAS